MSTIQYFQEEISFTLEDSNKVSDWIQQVTSMHESQVDEINYIFCSDEYLLKINNQYLDHNYYTDIITFDNNEQPGHLTADIFISIDRVEENAKDLNVPFQQELSRVMIHGLLHLLGYSDKTENEKLLMRQKEDACLSLLK